MTWYDVPPGQKDSTNQDWYEQAVLDAVRTGRAQFEYATVTSQAGGHTGTFRVFADALKIDGVRISCSATLEQQVADVLGCCLLTPRLADLAFQQRQVDVKPYPMPIASTVGAMVKESATVDKAVGGRVGLVQTVGKHWVLTNTLVGKKAGSGQAACNYGWQFSGDLFGGQRWGSAVTPGLRCIQDMGWAHDVHHADYSQTCVLVSRQCTVDGRPADLSAVLADPQLSALVSHEGPLRILRQPGVPQLDQRTPQARDGGGLVAMNGDSDWIGKTFSKENLLPKSGMIVGTAVGGLVGGWVGALVGGTVGAIVDEFRKL